MLYTIYICVMNTQLSCILIESKQCFLQIHTLYTKLKSLESSDLSSELSSFCPPFPEVTRVPVSYGVCTTVSSVYEVDRDLDFGLDCIIVTLLFLSSSSFSSFCIWISPSQSSVSFFALFGTLKDFLFFFFGIRPVGIKRHGVSYNELFSMGCMWHTITWGLLAGYGHWWFAKHSWDCGCSWLCKCERSNYLMCRCCYHGGLHCSFHCLGLSWGSGLSKPIFLECCGIYPKFIILGWESMSMLCLVSTVLFLLV